MKRYVCLSLLMVAGCAARSEPAKVTTPQTVPSTPEEKAKAVVAAWLDIAKTANGDARKGIHLATSNDLLVMRFPNELHGWKFWDRVRTYEGSELAPSLVDKGLKRMFHVYVMADYHNSQGVRVSKELCFWVYEFPDGRFLIDKWVETGP